MVSSKGESQNVLNLRLEQTRIVDICTGILCLNDVCWDCNARKIGHQKCLNILRGGDV